MHLFIGTAEDCDKKGALEIVNQIKNKPDTVLGLATGSTPIGMYQNLVQFYRDGKVSFSQVRTFNLDEYVGIPREHPCSYYDFMQENLFKDIVRRIDPAAFLSIIDTREVEGKGFHINDIL
jgi:6-phosphogluconolactonase/glucosamine-6-phosphate isomerase/deaminase